MNKNRHLLENNMTCVFGKPYSGSSKILENMLITIGIPQSDIDIINETKKSNKKILVDEKNKRAYLYEDYKFIKRKEKLKIITDDIF